MHFAYGKFAWSLNGKDDSTDAKKVSGNATIDQPFDYAAVSDLYFAAAFLPDTPTRFTAVTLHNSIELSSDPSDPNSQKRPADVIGVAVGDTSGSTRVRLFAGTKETDVLKSIRSTGPGGKPTGPSLEPLTQFGWLTIIAKPLYVALRYLHDHMGPGVYNWGWAIIIVTVIFNLLMLPTRFMMMKSSLKMMRIQPKVEAIKQRYKNLKATDPKRAEMNTEMMELYKVEGVNMYGSCLPMLVQMPLFFAYYRVLLNAVELRQAQWFWLHTGPQVHPAHPDHRHHVCYAVHHPHAGHGCRAAQDDGHHDAGNPRLHHAALCLRPGPLLGHRQHHQPGHAGGHQSIAHWQGDARNRRPPRR
jgi:YidC/Oxa1 family membrane protein insertase